MICLLHPLSDLFLQTSKLPVGRYLRNRSQRVGVHLQLGAVRTSPSFCAVRRAVDVSFCSSYSVPDTGASLPLSDWCFGKPLPKTALSRLQTPHLVATGLLRT